MSLSLYVMLFRVAPVGKSAIITGLRITAEELIKVGNIKSMDAACSHLVAAGFFSLDIGDFRAAAALADDLYDIHTWFVNNGGTHAQKMRSHGNGLLLRTAVRIFKHDREDLMSHYDDLQSDLSLVIVESTKYGKGWKPAQLQASQLQLYLDWFVLGDLNVQTWRTVQALIQSVSGEEKLDKATLGWFRHAHAGWSPFMVKVRQVFGGNTKNILDHIKSLERDSALS